MSSSPRAELIEVKIKDIGYVEDGAEEIRTSSLLDGQPAVTLIVAKQSGQNTVAVAKAVKETLTELQPTFAAEFSSADHRRQLDFYRKFACTRSKNT